MSEPERDAYRMALDEANRGRREAEAACAQLRHQLGRVAALLDGYAELGPNVARASTIAHTVPSEHEAGRAFLAHLERLEARVIAMEASERVPMIDCQVARCRFHQDMACTNGAPAVTLRADGTCVCWSYQDRSL